MRIFSGNLMKRLVSNSLITSFIIILVVSSLSFYYSKEALRKSAFEKLAAVSAIKKSQIIRLLQERLWDLSAVSKSNDVRKGIDLLNEYYQNTGGSLNADSEEYKAIAKHIDPFLQSLLKLYGYEDVYIISAEKGLVMYTGKRHEDLGTNLSTGAYRDSGLANIWAKTLKEKRLEMEDFRIYPLTRKPAAFIGAPVLDAKGNADAVVALQITPDQIDAIMTQRSGMGESGETYLVGQDLLMRSDSRFSDTSTVLKRKVDTVAAQNALKDQSGAGIIKDYREIDVLSVYTHLELNETFHTDFEWAIIAEIDADEAFAPVINLGLTIVIIGSVLILLTCAVAYFSAKAVAKPLSLGANTLATSVSEISATASELATSAAQTATSVSEISATVEEVRQTVHLSNEKAEHVVRRSEQVAQIASNGRNSTENTISGIKRIREEMEYIAESIVKLSEQTQSIGQIISAVNDLADQSNLLSVNASIEAAKAGEHGKGFAVVAQEVKSLAEQSKEATNQVKNILSDIQKATSAAVMATERGGKAVEAGVNLSAQAGDAIEALANSVNDSAQAAIQIASSSQEQLTGMDQLAEAMESIKDASNQNVDGARQLEDAIKGLNDLAANLKELAGGKK